MRLSDIKSKVGAHLYSVLEKQGIDKLKPCQEKAIEKGLLEDKNLVVCTPTASGKTLVAELVCLSKILEEGKKAIYIVPLKALAIEKYKDFVQKYRGLCNIGLSIGNMDKIDNYLSRYDLIITTSEKLDSLIRHKVPWLEDVGIVIIDEIHLLNDSGRGPTLEIIITILRTILKNVQIVGLSATIGNPQELADWLDANLVIDFWRPVELKEGVYLDGEIEFIEKKKED